MRREAAEENLVRDYFVGVAGTGFGSMKDFAVITIGTPLDEDHACFLSI